MTYGTPRQELRVMLRAQHSMNSVERYANQAVISRAAFRRFERLWAVGAATEHPYTASWSLERWRSRRDRVSRAVRAVVASH